MAIVTFSQSFLLNVNPARFEMTYTGSGITDANLTVAFKITAPSGNVIYNNFVNYQSGTLADIIGANSLTSSTVMLIPMNGSTMEQGVYKIESKTYDSGTLTTYLNSNQYEVTYVSPIVDISGTVQVYTPSPLITLQDNTVYVVNSVNPSIYRTCTISYEPMLINNVLTTPTPTVGHTATTTSNTFYSPTTELLSVVTNLEYDIVGVNGFSDYVILDTVSGSKSLFVDATTYCNVVCGLNTMALQVQANPNNEQLAEDFALAMGYWTLIMANQNCGNMDKISLYLDIIQNIGSFDKDCNCCGDKFQQVVGLGGLVSAYNVVSANSYILVTSVTSGGTTTFTVTLNPSFVAQVEQNTTDIATIQSQIITLQANSITLSSSDGTVHIVSTGTNPTNKDLQVRLRNSMSDEVSDTKTLSGTTPLVIFTSDATATIDGSYILDFEADFVVGTSAGSEVQCQYYFIKNGVATDAVGVNGTNEKRSIQALANISQVQILKISMKTKLDLVADDTINVVIVATDAHDTMQVANRSLLITRYSA